MKSAKFKSDNLSLLTPRRIRKFYGFESTLNPPDLLALIPPKEVPSRR